MASKCMSILIWDHFRMDLYMFPQFLILFPYGKIGGLHPVRGWFGSELPIDQFFANAHPEPGLVLSCCNLLAQVVKHRPWLGPGTSGDTDAAIRPCLIPVWIAALIGTVGCAGESQSAAEWDGTMRDSAGILIVENNDVPLWGEEDRWTLLTLLNHARA